MKTLERKCQDYSALEEKYNLLKGQMKDVKSLEDKIAFLTKENNNLMKNI